MSTTANPRPPSPAPDVDSEGYWAMLREHRLVLQRCAGCDRARFPAMPSCPYCGHSEWTPADSSGAGTIYSWVVVHRPFHPAFAGQVPYTILTVDLDDGPRAIGRIERGDPEHGARVEALFVDHDEWTELRFARAVGSTSGGARS